MPADLIVNGVPTNLLLPPGVHARHVDKDVFDICARLKEYDPNLRVIVIGEPGGASAFAIMEVGPDGVERLVMRSATLHAGLISECQRMVKIPLKDRMAAIDAANKKAQDAREDEMIDALYENVGTKMYSELFRSSLASTPRPESYRPLGKAARRAGRKV